MIIFMERVNLTPLEKNPFGLKPTPLKTVPHIMFLIYWHKYMLKIYYNIPNNLCSILSVSFSSENKNKFRIILMLNFAISQWLWCLVCFGCKERGIFPEIRPDFELSLIKTVCPSWSCTAYLTSRFIEFYSVSQKYTTIIDANIKLKQQTGRVEKYNLTVDFYETLFRNSYIIFRKVADQLLLTAQSF